jgi:hypothetical protein
LKLWITVKLEKPIENKNYLTEQHGALLILTRYKESLQHTKTRIGYTYCPCCDKTTKDYGGKKHFVIIIEETINSEIIFYFSFLENKSIVVMKCTVLRSHLLFEGTLSNWTCKIPNSDYLNLKQSANK